MASSCYVDVNDRNAADAYTCTLHNFSMILWYFRHVEVYEIWNNFDSCIDSNFYSEFVVF